MLSKHDSVKMRTPVTLKHHHALNKPRGRGREDVDSGRVFNGNELCMRTTWTKLVNSSRNLFSFDVLTRSPHRVPPANWHKHERIPAPIMNGLDDKFSKIYLFGWKQEFNSVRRILGACHLRKSHDAGRALSASPTTPLLPPQTQDSRLRRGRWHSIWRFWGSSCFHSECRCEFHGLDELKCRSGTAAQLQSGAPPPALPLPFLLNQWVCLQWKEEEGEKMRSRGRRWGGGGLMWSGELLVQKIKWGKENASEAFFLLSLVLASDHRMTPQ